MRNKTIYFLLILLYSCTSKSDEPLGLNKYSDSNVTAAENLFYNQASYYLNMEKTFYDLHSVREDSARIIYSMVSSKDDKDLAYKVFYKSNGSSFLTRKRLKGKGKNHKDHDSYIYNFDKSNKLINMTEWNNYYDSKNSTYNQRIEFEKSGRINENSRFIVINPEYRAKTDSVLWLYVFPFKAYKMFGKKIQLQLLNTKQTILYESEIPYPGNETNIILNEKTINEDTMILKVIQRYVPPELEEGHTQLSIIKKAIFIKKKYDINTVQFPKNMILPSKIKKKHRK